MYAIAKTAIAAACLVAASLAHANSEATLTVSGSLKPGSCTVAFNNSSLNYGTLQANSLEQSSPTALPDKTVGYALSCDGAVAVATSWVDDRQGSAYGTGDEYFGLGTSSSEPIGDYQLLHDLNKVTADGKDVHLLVSEDGTTWKLASAMDKAVKPGGVQKYSYTGTSNMTPDAFQQYAGELTVKARIAPTNVLDTSVGIKLDGSATLSVDYL